MKNAENDSRWVDEKLALLVSATDWRPNAGSGMARLQARDRAGRNTRRRWLWPVTMASAFIVALTLAASQSCAWGACLLPGNAGLLPAAAVSADAWYKVSGSPSAPITIEIYSDYECPYCAKYFAETLPLLTAQYVQTGKVKLIHRDFPLPQHSWAKLAARYANAAGEMGQYDAAAGQLFRTQDAWRENGNIDAQLMQVLPPGVMQRVREAVQRDAKLDDTVAADVAMGGKDHINQTPSLVIEINGKRQTLPAPPFTALKSYLDQLLAK